MWKKLPLRFRLFLPTAAFIAAFLLFGIFALQLFSPEQFENENEERAALVTAVTKGLNAALVATANPEQVLGAFAEGIGTGDAIQFRKAEASMNNPRIRLTTEWVPDWFVGLLRIPNIAAAHPVIIGQRRVGDIIFAPDLSADLLEKWLGFLAIVLSGSALLVLDDISDYLTVSMALRPLEEIDTGIGRMREAK
jgi:hypothetical protein